MTNEQLISEEQRLVYTDEYRLLQKVFAASSDLSKARCWPEFREATGGIEKLQKAHAEAVSELERWYDNFE